jgi:hypothetical protein
LRRSDWQPALDRFLAERRFERFHYGRLDCCLFAADAVFLMTGIDLASEYRNRYSTRRQALALLRAEGLRNIEELVERNMEQRGFAEIPPAYASRGDICLLHRPHRDSSLGIVDLKGRYVVVLSRDGYLGAPLKLAARAWRI